MFGLQIIVMFFICSLLLLCPFKRDYKHWKQKMIYRYVTHAFCIENVVFLQSIDM